MMKGLVFDIWIIVCIQGFWTAGWWVWAVAWGGSWSFFHGKTRGEGWGNKEQRGCDGVGAAGIVEDGCIMVRLSEEGALVEESFSCWTGAHCGEVEG